MLAAAAVLLLRLSLEDLRQRRLPNSLVARYGALCPAMLLISGAPAAQWLQHGILTAVGFLVLLTLFAARAVGGGDVKLGTAVVAWTDPQDLMPVLLVISLTGLLLALTGLLVNARGLRSTLGRGLGRRIRRSLRVRRGVPYGVALAMGGLFTMPGYLTS